MAIGEDFQVKNYPLKREIELEDFTFVHLLQILDIVPKFFETEYKIHLFTFLFSFNLRVSIFNLEVWSFGSRA